MELVKQAVEITSRWEQLNDDRDVLLLVKASVSTDGAEQCKLI